MISDLPKNQHPQILSVTKLTRKIKLLLEENLPIVWIYGEISNYRVPASGHAYFSLKDESAQISAVCFKGQVQRLKFKLQDGLSIVGMGRLSIYEPRGTYQIVLEYVEPQGHGALQLAFEQLKEKLTSEGLFDTEKKIPIPFLPKKIGLITSATGAVVHDLLKIILARFPTMALEIYPVRVQGALAETDISAAITFANQRNSCDVLIIARGGGSLEDLSPFNSETVARAIYLSTIPIVSAIGHETDFTIADFVADIRAATPSAAAHLVVPLKSEWITRISDLKQRAARSLMSKIKQYRRDISHLERGLVHPQKTVQDFQLRIDDMTYRMVMAVRMIIQSQKGRLTQCNYTLTRTWPKHLMVQYRIQTENAMSALQRAMQNEIGKLNERLFHMQTLLNVLNPLALLEKGYSIVRTMPDHSVITDSATVTESQNLEVMLAKGQLHVSVNRIYRSKKD